MTNELAELESRKLTTSSQTLLNKTDTAKLSVAVMELSLAKNIKLMDGTVGVWLKCLTEDIQKGLFELDDFIEATKKAIRKSAYNRLDYSDLYNDSVTNRFKSLELEGVVCTFCGANHCFSNFTGRYSAVCCDEFKPQEKDVRTKYSLLFYEYQQLSKH